MKLICQNVIAFKLVLHVVSNHMSDCNVHTTRPSVCWGKANCEQIACFKASVRDEIELCFINVPSDTFSCTGCVSVDHKHAISCIANELQDFVGHC